MLVEQLVDGVQHVAAPAHLFVDAGDGILHRQRGIAVVVGMQAEILPEVGQHLLPFQLVLGDLVEFLFQAGREVIGEILLEEARSEEHTSELQSLMRISYAVFCLKKKTKNSTTNIVKQQTTIEPR